MSEGRKFAVFDIDGTLIRWQLYHAVVDRLAKEGHLGDKAHYNLHEARMVWKRREHPEAFKQYEVELIKTYEESIANLPTEVFDNIAKEVANQYKDQVYKFTRNLAHALKNKKYFLIAISGSQEELVGEIAKKYNFDTWVGTQYERNSGRFTGKKFIASNDKKAVLERVIMKYDLSMNDSIAVGDSSSDIPMLDMVEHPIAFNPDQTLFEQSVTNGWKIVVERKNVIYELEKDSDGYRLA